MRGISSACHSSLYSVWFLISFLVVVFFSFSLSFSSFSLSFFFPFSLLLQTKLTGKRNRACNLMTTDIYSTTTYICVTYKWTRHIFSFTSLFLSLLFVMEDTLFFISASVTRKVKLMLVNTEILRHTREDKMHVLSMGNEFGRS